ncbi:hypothetical protein PR202_ga11754 [Eleusine coracana subsp. coracana]|uniref:Uncharacterized protein n=1 Tax=Eleusine coracana subsp. coracana TaxID=191504 RepID=A0AAV5C9T7_ELECO|nr:hypothetical protein PR202_ga11754 [Eleusine coracana subsp. coracana]
MERHGGGGGGWTALPRKAGLRRCGKSCRLRWLNYLRPDLRRGGFTPEEDQVICALYAAVGSRWSLIAAHLPGRTDNGVKNHWNTRLKKKLHLFFPSMPSSSFVPPPMQTRGRRRRGGYQSHHDDPNAAIVGAVAPQPLQPCSFWSWSSQTYGTSMSVGAGGETSMIAVTKDAAAAPMSQQPADARYSNELTELDAIFRSVSCSGGDHSDLTQSSSADMEASNWNQYQQFESVLQNRLYW